MVIRLSYELIYSYKRDDEASIGYTESINYHCIFRRLYESVLSLNCRFSAAIYYYLFFFFFFALEMLDES